MASDGLDLRRALRGAGLTEAGGADAGPHPPEPERERSASVGTAILGAGPAGLSGAYVLARRGAPGVVYEGSDAVGGIAQTVEVGGYRFDLGGHRFFTKLAPIERLWEEMLGEDFLMRPRLSRIYYDGRFLAYPLSARDVFARLGVVESARCALSYLATQAPAAPDAGDLRGVGDRPLRAAALRHVLPLLHAEGLGHPGLGDPGGVGGPADQGLLAAEGHAHRSCT